MIFRYTAVDVLKRPVKGKMDAQDAKGVAAKLKEMKLVPISVHGERGVFSVSALKGKFGGVSVSELANFTRQLSTMITAGLPLTDVLNLLKIQSPPAMAPAVEEIYTDVQGGVSLSEAMAKHPRIFSKVYVALVKAGEAAGVMDKIMNRLAGTMEKRREFSAKVKGAMIYPVIILLGMVGVMILMMVVVVPRLTTMYAEFNADLPWATKLIIWMSNLVINYWWALIILVVGIVMGLKAYLATVEGRRAWDKMLFELPVIGPLMQQVMLAEMTRTLALLIGAGISIVEALNIVSDSLGNVVVETDVKKIAKQVERGVSVTVGFSQSEVFPLLVGQMAAVGEETGRMDEVMEKLSLYFESNSEELIKGLTTAIEPIIIVVLGAGVGFLIFSIITPLYEITNKI